MKYKILIRDDINKYHYTTDVSTLLPQEFETLEEVKEEYLKLINIYPKSQIDVVKDVKETIEVNLEEESAENEINEDTQNEDSLNNTQNEDGLNEEETLEQN